MKGSVVASVERRCTYQKCKKNKSPIIFKLASRYMDLLDKLLILAI